MEILFVGEWNDINVGRLENNAAVMAENGKTTNSAENKHISENQHKTLASGVVIWWTFSSLESRNGRNQSDYDF